MSDDSNAVKTGTIKYVDHASRNGVIAYPTATGNADAYFEYSDIDIGTPQEGKLVQFVMQPGPLSAVAKKINVIADVARGMNRRAI